MDLALARFGRVDVIVNLAGLMIFKSLEDLTSEDWKRLLGVNLMGAVYFTKRALAVMSPGSAIVNVSSVHAVQTSILTAPYAASKAALVSLTRSTAIEGKAKGVRANAVLPGAVDTPMLRANPVFNDGMEHNALENVGEPADVAAVIAFLASRDAAFITGSAITVDGGRLATL
jgi:NAD(P)-dependent dehydrogenase (short-subunit alcohol dehydrogenase family)